MPRKLSPDAGRHHYRRRQPAVPLPFRSRYREWNQEHGAGICDTENGDFSVVTRAYLAALNEGLHFPDRVGHRICTSSRYENVCQGRNLDCILTIILEWAAQGTLTGTVEEFELSLMRSVRSTTRDISTRTRPFGQTDTQSMRSFEPIVLHLWRMALWGNLSCIRSRSVLSKHLETTRSRLLITTSTSQTADSFTRRGFQTGITR